MGRQKEDSESRDDHRLRLVSRACGGKHAAYVFPVKVAAKLDRDGRNSHPGTRMMRSIVYREVAQRRGVGIC
jgi:hypothetical protein